MAPFADADGQRAALWRRAYSIFEAALALPAEERENFARARSAGDPELLPIVVELLHNAAEEENLDEADRPPPGPAPGATYGRYRIVAKLGRGGMGNVYHAHDTELGRTVALKFLHNANSASSTDSARRLVQEARAASALNHPNIVTVFDVVHQDNEVALAMELVDRSSLRDYCGSPQPVDVVVRWARQIAQALGATHARGIVHRDIKPENIMVRRDGYIKVLDFGLASGLIMPNVSSRSTLSGLLGGTLNYMSPEQTRGEAPGPASDIFSVGTVLYELLCGCHPFLTASPIDTAYAIAHHDPKSPETLRPGIPPDLSAIVVETLAKSPSSRPSAQEVERRLSLLENHSFSTLPLTSRPLRRYRPVLLIAASLVAFAAFAAFFRHAPRDAPPRPGADPVRYTIPVPAGYQAQFATVSPKGDRILYTAHGPSGVMLYQRFLDSTELRPVPGSEGAVEPFFSPDGQEFAFFTPDRLRVVASSGFRDLAPVDQSARRFGFWGEDGFVYFTSSEGGMVGVWREPARGGKRELVLNSVETARGFAYRFGQQLLPRGLLYSVNYGPVSRSIEWVDLPGGATHRLIERGMGGQVTPTGHLVYYWNGSLFAAPFDAAARKLTGSPVEVLSGVLGDGWTGGVARFSNNGTLVYLRQPDLPRRTISWMTKAGKETPLPLPPADYLQAEASPDGQRLAIIRRDGFRLWTLWTYGLKSGAWTRVIETPVEMPRAVWSPDSQSLVVGLELSGGEFANLYRVPLAHPGKAERLSNQPNCGQFPASWSGPANAILFVEGTHPRSQSDIMILPLGGSGQPRALVETEAIDRSPSFSPDGRRFVYSTDLDGQVYIKDVEGAAQARRISGPDGGMNPLWAPDGKHIYYLNRLGGLVEVAIDHSGNPGKPRELMATGFTSVPDIWTRGYSLAPDGRFLVIHIPPVDRPPSSEINVVMNWFTELNRLAPVP